MFKLRQTLVFKKWFLGFKRNSQAREAIAKRLVRLEAGILGDTKSLGGGINEFKGVNIDHLTEYNIMIFC